MTGEAPIRVLVVDDSAFMRRAISLMLDKHQGISVVGTACNGVKAIEEAKRLQPDVVTLDIEMPEMDGLTALRHIKRACPAAVLMVSSLTTEGSHATLTALNNGASDFLAKDLSQVSLDIVKIEDELVAKVNALGRNHHERRAMVRFSTPAESRPPVCRIPALSSREFGVLMIGSSTGGPPVLEQIISNLPADFPLPVVVAQHMPVLFTRALAERLDKMSKLTVEHAEHGACLHRGHVYIAQGGQHLRVRKGGLCSHTLEVSGTPADALYKPSVNELLASGAEAYGGRVLGIILTGMGDDGLLGATKLRERGGKIIAQNHESCAVYGMPKAVTQAGLVLASLAPEQIVKALQQMA